MCGWRVCDEGVYVCMRDEGELRCVGGGCVMRVCMYV